MGGPGVSAGVKDSTRSGGGPGGFLGRRDRRGRSSCIARRGGREGRGRKVLGMGGDRPPWGQTSPHAPRGGLGGVADRSPGTLGRGSGPPRAAGDKGWLEANGARNRRLKKAPSKRAGASALFQKDSSPSRYDAGPGPARLTRGARGRRGGAREGRGGPGGAGGGRGAVVLRVRPLRTGFEKKKKGKGRRARPLRPSTSTDPGPPQPYPRGPRA